MLQPKDTDWLNGYKHKTVHSLSTRLTSDLETHTYLKERGQKQIFHAHGNQNMEQQYSYQTTQTLKYRLLQDTRKDITYDKGINPRRYNTYTCTQDKSTSIYKTNTNSHKRRIQQKHNSEGFLTPHELLTPHFHQCTDHLYRKTNKETQALNDTKTIWTSLIFTEHSIPKQHNTHCFQVYLEHSPGLTTWWGAKQVVPNLRKFKSHQASFPTTMLQDQKLREEKTQSTNIHGGRRINGSLKKSKRKFKKTPRDK